MSRLTLFQLLRPALLGLAIVPALWAQPAEPQSPAAASSELQMLQQQLQELKSARGQFEQMIREQDGYLLDRQTGSFSLQKPRLLRWEISQLDQLLVSDGETLYLYDELFQQVTLRDWVSDPASNPAAILLDDIWLGDWADVQREGDTFVLLPFGRATSIREIRLQMKDGFPSSLTLLDFSGQITEIRFTQVETNLELQPELFSFEIPPGVEVIYDEAGR